MRYKVQSLRDPFPWHKSGHAHTHAHTLPTEKHALIPLGGARAAAKH